MPFTLACPGCQSKLKATEALVGKTIKCPRCSKPVLIQEPSPTAVATMPRMELPPARVDEPEEHAEFQDDEPVEQTEELDELPQADDVEEAELDEAVAADDDYDDGRSRRIRKGRKRSSGVTPEDRQMAMFIYLSGLLLGFVVGPLAFIGPLVLWLMKRDESKFVDHHGKEVLNFTITMAIAGLALGFVGAPVVLLTFGIGLLIVLPLAMGLGIYNLVLTIMGAVKANNGEWYEFPISIRLIK